MKTIKIIYWICTVIICGLMLFSAVMTFIPNPQNAEMAKHIGYPDYIFKFLAVAKILAVIAILVPGYPRLKEWAYAGLFFVMTGALVSHLAIGHNGIMQIIGPIMQTVFIILSWYFRPADRKIVTVN